ncbi:putative hemolysin [Rubricella aquisinus]|uniref:Putative hemolysin n=1 Tax=Rubricella aquisinus TaxID=2028108 RepID=A0A840WKS4_9RHOB|nr:1-acyl-sn-glycerol-3-phosphate acyltransferase [Rubricella aquisinus]MBB5515659.1 putative hemolysin [Rubricella aquisinus]
MSYYSAAKSRGGQMVIRTVENLTGRIGALMRLRGLEQDLQADGANIWDCLFRRFDMRLATQGAPLEVLKTQGPLLIIANHPFGMADGMALMHLMSHHGRDFRLIANDVLWQVEALRPYLLPFNVTGAKGGQRRNLETRAAALDRLRAGGVVMVFPSGATASAATPFGPVREARWTPFIARLAQDSGAQVLPIWIDGANPRLFQIAPFVHPNLRHGLQLYAFRSHIGKTLHLTLGTPFQPDLALPRAALTMELRRAVLSLAPDPQPIEATGPIW